VEAGATVVVADWNSEALEKAVLSLADAADRARALAGRAPPTVTKGATGGIQTPPLVSGRKLDVSDATAVRAFVDRVVDTHGKLDIVFATAGVARGRPPLLPEGWLDDMSMTDYNALIDVNLHGVVYTVQAAARHMKRQRSGSIVTTASTAGLRNDPYTPYSYAIAKAGVVNLPSRPPTTWPAGTSGSTRSRRARSRPTSAAAPPPQPRPRTCGGPSFPSAEWAA
jgi:NAD(P)-dependent dehydrogenase (short-subunit alcohol dehydrogenase family)